MKKSAMLGISALFLLSAYALPSLAAPGPGHFAGVPWGAESADVDQAMSQQNAGFRHERTLEDGSIERAFDGTLADTDGELDFTLVNGTFVQGAFQVNRPDGGEAEALAYRRFYAIISEKYGPPARIGPVPAPGYAGAYAVWYGLRAPGNAGMIQVRMVYQATRAKCGPQLCGSRFYVQYSNLTLVKRQAAQTPDGL